MKKFATHKVRTLLELDVPKFGARVTPQGDVPSVQLKPAVIEAKWTRNNHLVADELFVIVGWKEGGLDPRAMRNARCQFFMWDAASEDFDRRKHLRFTGIATKIHRRLSDSGWVVEMSFQDYTTMFINMKPFPTVGMPEYTDTLQQIWQKICDNTGWMDPSNKKIVSSVRALRDGLEIRVDEYATKTLGELVNKRFLEVAKPTPKNGSSAWDVWQWCCGALGLLTYIEADRCVVTNATEHFDRDTAPRAIYGQNIYNLEEEVDTAISLKGILLKSFDPLGGRVLEARYPPEGDQRLKTARSAVGPKSPGGTAVTANEASGDYEEYFRYDITTQDALDRAALQAYEERSRQSMEGSFRTAETEFDDKTLEIERISIFDLKPGDKVRIELAGDLLKDLRKMGGDEQMGGPDYARIRYLVDNLGYDEGVAKIIVQNLDIEELQAAEFNITSVEHDLHPASYEAEVKFHNLILTDD